MASRAASRNTVGRGDILLVALPSHSPNGREQDGTRPAVVVGIPTGTVRYPIVVVVPLTTRDGRWARANPELYPRLLSGQGGLPHRSVVLLDQVRGIDVRRVLGYIGTLGTEEFSRIQVGLRGMLGL